ncbi:MAG: hypothetical protein ABSH41_13340 [Syntrophobacteraceae bacterium]|jgi:hypothetical protein
MLKSFTRNEIIVEEKGGLVDKVTRPLLSKKDAQSMIGSDSMDVS